MFLSIIKNSENQILNNFVIEGLATIYKKMFYLNIYINQLSHNI